jgi:hypothetical protein
MSEQTEVAKVLKELFPLVEDLDWDVVAAHLLERVDLDATRQMRQREDALQEALSATMNYLGTINKALHRRIAELETKNGQLHERLAQKVTLPKEQAS